MAIEETSSPPSAASDPMLVSLVDRAMAAVATIEQQAQTAMAQSAEVTAAKEAAASALAAAAAANAAASESHSLMTSTTADAQAKLAEIAAVATQAAAAKTQIADSQGVIATKSDHIEGAQKHADTVRGQLDRLLTTAQASLTETEGLKTRSVTLNDAITQMHAAVTTSKADTDSNSEATRTALATAQVAAAAAKKLADKANETDAKIADYESRLAELERQSKEQLSTIVGLLPGATSAGLASAFDKRRQTFLEPSKRWQNWFVGSIIALIVLAGSGLVQLYMGTDVLTYEKLLRVWLARLPVAGALIWLALYTSREAALAKRLEEDYGYKSAIAASFQGFQKQMQDIAATVSAESPLGKLCHDTLTAIATPPGLIYDKHALTVSPGDEIKEMAGALSDALGKLAAK